MTAACANPRTTNQPVRRESLDVDDPRAQVFRPIEGGIMYVDVLIDAFYEWANQIKIKGRSHELTANCGRVLTVLLRRCTDFSTGICEPCLDTIQTKTRLARATVVRCLALLRRHGFRDWIRRTEMIPDAKPGEQQVRQISNAYWFDLARLPKRVAMWVAAGMRKKKHPIEIPREPRRPIFAGRYKRRRQEARQRSAAAWREASPAEQAAILYPDDPAAQRVHLDMLAEGASSGTILNPPPHRSKG
jgi:hypothetical protein